jgi:hypothetical protein
MILAKNFYIIAAGIMSCYSFSFIHAGGKLTVIPDQHMEQQLEKDTINKPELVRADTDGTFRLTAENGKAVGPNIKYMPEWKAFGWFTASDLVEWKVQIIKGGAYEVYLEWSVSNQEAGKSFVFEASEEQLIGKVSRTGSWEKFRTKKIGRILLQGGTQQLLFKPGSKFEKGALLDFRQIKLVSVK